MKNPSGVKLEAITTKDSTLAKVPEMEPHLPMQYSFKPRRTHKV